MASRNRTRIRRPAALTAAALVACLLAGSAQANPANPASQASQTSRTNQAHPATLAGPAGPAAVEPQVWDQLQAGGSTDFWVYLRQQADLAPARASTDRAAQGEFVHQRLTRTAEASQAGLRAMLRAADAPHQPYWIANAVRVTGDAELLERIAARPEVAQVTADRVYQLPEPAPGEAAPAAGPVEWNIDRIRAPEVWDTYGATGAGIVVGTIDSGAQFDHPALVRQYRGNLGDGGFDHDYHWHDPSGVCGSPSLAPCDNEGHGTHVLGTILGDDGAGNQIGVAPGARWIAAKGCESRTCSQGALLSSGQFMLAPTDLQGENPDPQRRPHVVNNSWGGGATTDPWYRPTVQAWLAAGIFPQFAAGNTTNGVAPCGSAGNPGNLAESYAAGAFDIDGEIADFSNRGPSAWDRDLVKPDIAAPGADIRSSVPGGGYAPNSGTSMASPHVAGAVALLWSAAGALVREIDATRDLLDRTAIDAEDLTCGGEPGDNNVWGEGRLDVLAAVEAAPRGPSGRLSGVVSDAGTGAPIAGATITIAGQERERTTGPDGRYEVVLPVGEHQVTAAAFGYAPETAAVTITEDGTITRDFPLEPVPQITVSGQVTDGSGHGWPLYALVEVPGTPVRTFTDPVTGRYRLRLPAGEAYQVRAVPRYPGYAGATGAVPAGDQDLTLDLPATVDSCEQAPGYDRDGECQPVAGGLVLGQVTDANTGDPVTGATVSGVDRPGESGRSVATPDDPAVGDGFYWLFSSRTGRTEFAASARHYAGSSQPADVVADGIAEASFALAAGRLTVEPAGVEAQLRLGRSTERTVTVTNTGTAPAELDLGELPGSFEVLGGGGGEPAPRGQAWRPPAGLPDPGYDPDSPTTEGQYQQPPRPDATPSAPGDILAAWPPDGLSLAWGVGFDGSEVWLSDAAFGVTANHEFTVDGTGTGAHHSTPWAGSWPADMSLLGEGEMCQVAVGGDNGIHCWDPGSGAVTRAITGEFPWTARSQRGLAYRPDDDTFYIGGWNQDVLYQVAGFSHPTPGAVLHQCAFPGMGISGLAWNPTAALVWVATNTATDDIHLVDPDGCRVRDSIGHPTPGFNGGGLALAPGGDLWLTSQPNSGAESAAYLIESGVPDVTDLPWLAASPQRATLPPGASRTVTIAIDSAATDQQQPGTYTAQLRVGHDTPYPVEPVGVTMAVTPPPTWGTITGTVTGLDCGGEQRVPFGATVQLGSRDLDAELRTDASGGYTYWAHVRHNPVQVQVPAVDGYGPGSGRAVVRPAHPAVVDVTVRRADGFGYTCEPEEAEFAPAGTVLPITGRNETGTIDLPFPFRFYGQNYLRAHVCSNGYLEFVGPGTSFPIGCSFPSSRIPSQARPDAAIYPYRDSQLWVDAEASIRAEAQGAAPDRRLVVEFRNLRFADLEDPARRVDFTVVLHENGDVLTQYRDIADDPRERGGSALIGLEDHTGTVALPYAFEQPVLPVGATSIRYRPPPPPEPEPGPESWAARYDGPGAGDDTVRAIAASPDGSRVFVTGQSPGDGTGNDYATVAFDTRTGEQLWVARYDGPTGGGDVARSLGVSPDGSRVFVTGFGPGEGTGSDYATVAYHAGTGQQLWATRYHGPDGGGDEASALAVSPDGGQVFVTGRSTGDGTSFDYATVAYDAASGTQSWAARYDGPQPSFGLDQAFALGVSPDSGRVYVTGQSRGDGTGYDYATVAYDTADGTQAWVARYDGPVAGGADVAWAVAVSPDGSGVYVTGQSQGDGTGNDYATIGYDAADGTQSWAARYDGPVSGSDLAWAIGVSPDGASVFVTGQSPGGVATGAEYATVAYQAGAGQQLGSARYQGPVIGDSVARALAVSPDGARVYVSGDSAGVTGIDYATLAYDTAALTGTG